MKIEDVKPGHCHSLALRFVGELELLRDEMGRDKDGRRPPEVTGASPRACYFQAIALWHSAARLCGEVGIAIGRPAPPAPPVVEITPGHVHQLVESALLQIVDVKHLLGIANQSSEPTADLDRQPSDVLAVLVQANRELVRLLEAAPTPSDVYTTVALAAAYATRMTTRSLDLAPFEHRKRPADCYARLESALATLGTSISKRGQPALVVKGTPNSIVPSDCYDLAHSVLGEIAYLHALMPKAAAVQPFEPCGIGNRLPAHVHQLVRTLELQLAAL
jgi:hypothetical protein